MAFARPDSEVLYLETSSANALRSVRRSKERGSSGGVYDSRGADAHPKARSAATAIFQAFMKSSCAAVDSTLARLNLRRRRGQRAARAFLSASSSAGSRPAIRSAKRNGTRVGSRLQ